MDRLQTVVDVLALLGIPSRLPLGLLAVRDRLLEPIDQVRELRDLLFAALIGEPSRDQLQVMLGVFAVAIRHRLSSPAIQGVGGPGAYCRYLGLAARLALDQLDRATTMPSGRAQHMEPAGLLGEGEVLVVGVRLRGSFLNSERGFGLEVRQLAGHGHRTAEDQHPQLGGIAIQLQHLGLGAIAVGADQRQGLRVLGFERQDGQGREREGPSLGSLLSGRGLDREAVARTCGGGAPWLRIVAARAAAVAGGIEVWRLGPRPRRSALQNAGLVGHELRRTGPGIAAGLGIPPHAVVPLELQDPEQASR